MSADRLDLAMRELVRWTTGSSVDRRGLAIDELVSGARAHRLVGVLAAAAGDGALDLDGDERQRLDAAHLDAMSEVLLLEEVLLDAVDVLDGESIESRVLKGSALAHSVHPDPSHRSFGDTDLLVGAGAIDRAVTALGRAGAERLAPALSPDWDRRFAKSVTFRWSHGTELDLHRTLAPGAFGLRIEIEDLWTDASRFELAGRQLATFAPETHLVHAWYHLALGDAEPRYGNLRDVVLLLRSDIDLASALAAVERWRGRAVVAEAAARLARVGFRDDRLSGWVERHPPAARDRRLLTTHRARRHRFRRQALAAVRDIPWRDRAAYSRAVLLRR